MNGENGNFSGLNGIRNDYRSNATNMLQALKQLLDSSSIDQSRIRNTVELLKQVKDNLSKCDDSIQVLLEEDAFIKDMEESLALSANIDKDIKRAESLLDILIDETLEAKFNGESVDWYRFWENLEREIHRREDLPLGLKYTCLKHRLDGWPLNMISKLGSGDSAYNEALKLLQTTFSNKKVLVESHLNALLDLEPPTATPVSLMRFSSDFEYHIRALKAYGTSIDEEGFFVAAVLNKKLPKEIWNRVNKADRTSYWTLPEFQNALKFEIQLLNFELAQQENKHSAVKPQNATAVTVEDDSACKSEATEAKGLQDSSKYSLMCQLCSGSHHFSGCTVYKTSFKKMERSKQLNLCLICVKHDHTTENCLKPIGCTLCKGKHNTMLCLTGEALKESNGTKVKKKIECEVNPIKKVQENILCTLCNGKHQFGICKKFETPLKKHERAVILNLCQLCLKETHKTSDCLKNSFCKNCGGKHNTLLCLGPSSIKTQETKKKKKRTRNRAVKRKQATNIPNGYEAAPVQSVKKAAACVQSVNLRTFVTDINTRNIYPDQGNTHATIPQNRSTTFPNQNIKPNLKNESFTCTLCSGNHHFAVCGKYKTSIEKRIRALELKLCSICVNKKHTTSNCLKLQVCKFCCARHHTLLCVESERATNIVIDKKLKDEKRSLKRKAAKERKKKEKVNSAISDLITKPKENKPKNGTSVNNALVSSFIKISDI